MNELIPMITERDGIPVTTSRAVAEQFGKAHKNVIRDIETLISQLKIEPANAVFAEQNFLQIEQADAQGKPRPAYLLTRDGFTLLAMGFTGAKAMQFKIAYINAFDRMESLIRGGVSSDKLQLLETRLQALEATTTAGKEDAEGSIANSFLQALQAAVSSGEYIIVSKRHNVQDIKQNKLLGVYEGCTVTLKAWQAYKIYSKSANNPLDIRALWAMLERTDTIQPRAETGKMKTFKGKRVAAIVLNWDKAKALVSAVQSTDTRA